MAKETRLALAKGFRTKGSTPEEPPESPLDLSTQILSDANKEAVRFLQDVALDVQYGPYAAKGLKVEQYTSLLRLAIQDIFQDLTEDQKREGLNGADLDALRSMPDYTDISERLVASAERLTKPETAKQWIERVADRVRRNVERGSRQIDHPTIGRDALKAATEILEIETPKASRMPGTKMQISFPPEMLQLMAAAFKESNVLLPQATIVDAEPLPDGDSSD